MWVTHTQKSQPFLSASCSYSIWKNTCRLPSCRDWHRVMARVLGRLSLFLVFGVWAGVFPSWRTEQQLVKDTLTYTHASKSESLIRGHTPSPPPLCLCPCPFLCPPPAFILSSIIYDWRTLSHSTTPSTRCQHWPVNGSLLHALISLRVQLSCWTVSDSCLIKEKDNVNIFC